MERPYGEGYIGDTLIRGTHEGRGMWEGFFVAVRLLVVTSFV